MYTLICAKHKIPSASRFTAHLDLSGVYVSHFTALFIDRRSPNRESAIEARARSGCVDFPVNIVQKVVDQLITYGAVVPPEIGVEPQDLTQQLAEAFDLEEGIGVLVAGIKKGSPAEAAGLRRRYIIEAIDQKTISSSETFLAMTRLFREDQTTTFRVLRDGKRRDLCLRIRKLQWNYAVPGWGITIEQLNRQQTEKYTQRGVLVTKVQPRSTLAQRGLKQGDLIYRINRLKVNSLEDLKRIINQLQPPQRISLYFERDGRQGELSDLVVR